VKVVNRFTGVAVLLAVTALTLSSPGTSSASPSGVHVLGKGVGLSSPGPAVTNGADYWVGNTNGSSISEFNIKTGAFIRLISGAAVAPLVKQSQGQIFDPAAFALVGNDLWVLNGASDIGEISDTTGVLIRTVSGAQYGFESPSQMILVGSTLVVGNGGGSLIEISDTTGALIRTVSDQDSVGDIVDGLASDGTNVFATFSGSTTGSLVEFNVATGALVQSFDTAAGDPQSVVAANGDVWVDADVYPQPGYVLEFNATSGALLHTIQGPSYDFTDPYDMVTNGVDIWVGQLLSSMTEFSATTGALVRVLSGATYQLDFPNGLLTANGDLWAANTHGNTLTELSATTGALVKVVSGSSYELNQPQAMAIGGSYLFVLDELNNAVTEIDSRTGDLVRVITSASLLQDPMSVASDGTHLWVACTASVGGSIWIAQYNAATGAYERSIPNLGTQIEYSDHALYAFNAQDQLVKVSTIDDKVVFTFTHLDSPSQVTPDGTNLWLEDYYSEATTPPRSAYELQEISGTTGKVLATLKKAAYDVADGVNGLVIAHGNLWALNESGLYITETSLKTLKVVHSYTRIRFHLDTARAIATNGSDVWLTNQNGMSVTEISAVTGALVHVYSGAPYDFNTPINVVVSAGKVFVANVNSNTITEFPAG
jgi:hypothetical protein